MTLRDEMLKTIRFGNPDRIFGCMWWDGEGAKHHSAEDLARTTGALPAPWQHHGLHVPGMERVGNKRVRDTWGCIWQEEIPGIAGQVVENPIASWDALADYQPPMHLLEAGEAQVERIRSEIAASPDLLHMIGWMQLYERMRYLRPAQDLYIDLAMDSPEVYQLRDCVMTYLHRELDLYLQTGADVVVFSEDWGTQTALQISPELWRKVFKPAYRELFDRIHNAGAMVEFHSCGFIRDIIDDLIDLKVEIVHSQVGCMDLSELARRFGGRICFKADFDRQKIPTQSAQWVREEVQRIVKELGSPRGGLFLVAEVAGATPLENVEAYIEAIRG